MTPHALRKKYALAIILLFLLNPLRLWAQQESTPEFTKGFVGYLNLQQGVVTDFKTSPDYYQVGFAFHPRYTVLPSRLRAGSLLAGIYTRGRWTAQTGATPVRQYVDGGVQEYAGIQLAIEQGTDEVFVIILSGEVNVRVEKRYTSVPDILMRTIEIFTEDLGENDVVIPLLYNKALRYMDAVRANLEQYGIPENKIVQLLHVPGNPFSNKRSVNLHIIRPDGYLGGEPGGLTFDPAEMKVW